VRGFAGPVAPPQSTLENHVFSDGQSIVFEAVAEGESLRYRYLPASGSLNDLTVEVDDLPPFWISFFGGPIFVFGDQEIPIWEGEALTWSHTEPLLTPKGLIITWTALRGEEEISYTYQFSIHGKTLRLEIDSSEGKIGALSLDRTEATPKARILSVPYLSTFDLLFYKGYFLSAYFDWTLSNASRFEKVSEPYSEQSFHFSQMAFYEPDTAATRHPLHEVVYFTVSKKLADVLPSIPNPPSPYRERLAGVTVVDFWSENNFLENERLILELSKRGLQNLLAIRHPWQRCGYDDCYPSVLPAREEWGGDPALRSLSKAAADAGYLFALHENYVDFYQNSDLWSPDDVALEPQGSWRKAWFNESTGRQSYLLSPQRAVEIAAQFSPEIHRRYHTTAAFLDVHTAIPPWEKTDYNHRYEAGGRFSAVFEAYRELLSFLRETHEGPVLGEGGAHFIYAGYVDGVQAEFQENFGAGMNVPPIVDFALLRLHPLMVNYGVGYYPYYFSQNGEPKWEGYTLDDHYHYMATEIAFCHAAYVDTPELFETPEKWLQWVEREVRLVSPIHLRCALAKPVRIVYHVEGQMVGIEQAVVDGQVWQVLVEYDNGLQIYVNRHAELGWLVELQFLPSWVAFSALENDSRKDYVGEALTTTYLLPPNGWLALMP